MHMVTHTYLNQRWGIVLIVMLGWLVYLSIAQALSISSFTTFTGEVTGDNAGRWIDTGDLNGDGYSDTIIGAHDGIGAGVGAVYILYGQSGTVASTVLSNSAFVKLTGESTNDHTGVSVAIGDVNNDNYDDIVIGADQNDDAGTNAGAVYLIYGGSSTLTSASLSTAIEFTAEVANDRAGAAVATGDVNGDGFDDILVGAGLNDDAGTDAGAVYLLYGKSITYTAASLSTAVEFTGEVTNDRVSAHISTGDINADGYDDIVTGSDLNDDGGVDAGALYIIYGTSASLSSANLSTAVEFTGEVGGDNAGTFTRVSDVTHDNYADIITSAGNNDDGGTDTGALYIISGQSTTLTAKSLSDASITEIFGNKSPGATGKSIATGDLNNDDYVELLFSAPTADADTGVVYLGYLGIDNDLDTVLGSSGSLLTGTDCNDSDSTVSSNQTYYADSDGDGLGDAAVTTSVCSATAPTGYVTDTTDTNDDDADNDGAITDSDCNDADNTVSTDQTYYQDVDGDTLGDAAANITQCTATPPAGYVTNDDDTSDTIPNFGIEIDGDTVDNDTDGEIDEVNTLTENGAHPYYSTLDPNDTTLVTTAITTITPKKRGNIKIEYADNSVYSYNIFETDSTNKIVYARYEDTAYAVMIHHKGKNLALVNLYTGTVLDKTKLSQTKTYRTNSLKFLDLRTDDVVEAIITSIQKSKQVHLSVVKIKLDSETLNKKDSLSLTLHKVDQAKTKVHFNEIVLRQSNGDVVERITANKQYQLSVSK